MNQLVHEERDVARFRADFGFNGRPGLGGHRTSQTTGPFNILGIWGLDITTRVSSSAYLPRRAIHRPARVYPDELTFHDRLPQ